MQLGLDTPEGFSVQMSEAWSGVTGVATILGAVQASLQAATPCGQLGPLQRGRSRIVRLLTCWLASPSVSVPKDSRGSSTVYYNSLGNASILLPLHSIGQEDRSKQITKRDSLYYLSIPIQYYLDYLHLKKHLLLSILYIVHPKYAPFQGRFSTTSLELQPIHQPLDNLPCFLLLFSFPFLFSAKTSSLKVLIQIVGFSYNAQRDNFRNMLKPKLKSCPFWSE